nr:ribosomal protein L13 [Proteomonas sp. NEIS-1375]
MNKTTFQTGEKGDYTWYVVDANQKRLGRLSSEVSKILLGKNVPEYDPSQPARHAVIVINAEKIEVTGNKRYDKLYKRHSGQPGGLRIETFNELQTRIPSRIIEQSVRRMLPKGALGRHMFTKLKVYKGSSHPHEAQNPQLITL